MQSKVQKWGNSLAVRIPGAFAKELALEHNHPVDISVTGDTITIKPLLYPRFLLSELLNEMTERNLHTGKGIIDFTNEINR